VVKAAGATIIGEGAERLPNTLFMAVPDWESPQQLITLDLMGLMVSAGSACSSGKTKPSRAISGHGAGRSWPPAASASRAAGARSRTTGHASPGRGSRPTPNIAADLGPGERSRLMAAVQKTIDAVAALEKYEHGFTSEIETEYRAQGAERRHRALHLREEGRAGMDAGMASGRL
jgi:hypothetical protein